MESSKAPGTNSRGFATLYYIRIFIRIFCNRNLNALSYWHSLYCQPSFSIFL